MEILPRHKDVWIGENVRLKNFFAFFCEKNWRKENVWRTFASSFGKEGKIRQKDDV